MSAEIWVKYLASWLGGRLPWTRRLNNIWYSTKSIYYSIRYEIMCENHEYHFTENNIIQKISEFKAAGKNFQHPIFKWKRTFITSFSSKKQPSTPPPYQMPDHSPSLLIIKHCSLIKKKIKNGPSLLSRVFIFESDGEKNKCPPRMLSYHWRRNICHK